MQAGTVTLGTTTSAVFGPVAGASHVVLVQSGGTGQIFLGASAGLDPTNGTDRANLCLASFSNGTGGQDGYLPLRMGEGETLYAASPGLAVLDFVVFPE